MAKRAANGDAKPPSPSLAREIIVIDDSSPDKPDPNYYLEGFPAFSSSGVKAILPNPNGEFDKSWVGDDVIFALMRYAMWIPGSDSNSD